VRRSPPPTDVPTFVDPADERAFRADGYVVVDLLGADVAADLLATCRHHHPVAPTGARWESDFYTDDRACKVEVDEAIREAIRPPLGDLLADHRTLMHNFVVNWPGAGGGLSLHHHSSLVDERHFRSVVVWCALNEATEANGTLHVVPGSHLVPRGPKGERSPEWFGPLEDALLDRHLVSVPLRPGQAILFDNALLHCSFANVSDEPRMTAVSTVAPNAASVRYYEWVGDGRLEYYALDPSFFFDSVAGELEWAKPEGLPLLGTDHVDMTPPSMREVEAVIGRGPGTCRHEGRDPG